ncbi:MAG: alpha/beta hydrolase [Pleurocapsa sp. MO_192.B19]|nr:alpha/beta hydrolase [Pleurocapsa sp. MO_192.B19]
MHIKYFATNRDREHLGRDFNRDTRIKLQKGGYNWIDTKQYMSYYLATTDPTTMPSEAIIENSQEIIFNNFLNYPSIKHIIVCIHGFNVHLHGALTSFSVLIDTLKKTTKLGSTIITDPTTDEAKDYLNTMSDLTAVVGFSWPSNGSVFDYASDRLEAVSSASTLANLISAIRNQNPNAKIHIIAHSMGNFLTCEMLGKLVNKEISTLYHNEQIEKMLKRRDHGGESKFFVDCYIMLAPDVERRHVTQCDKHDSERKADYLGPFYAGLYHLVGGVYLFYSRHDSALKASKVEKEAREKIGAIKEIFTGRDLNNLWEDSLGLNPAPELAPSNIYSYNASTLSNRPIDHGDYFDTVAIAEKISESILNYKLR